MTREHQNPVAAYGDLALPQLEEVDLEAVLSERDPAQTMRQRPQLCVAQLEDTLGGAALLRATALDAGPLPAERYFRLGARVAHRASLRAARAAR